MSGIREAVIDASAIAHNVAAIRAAVGTAHTMAVVKADGYGHGAVTAARAALAGGADWLGVADIAEGLELRAAGIDAPILAWLHDPFADFEPAVAAGLDLGISTREQLERIAASPSGAASIQLKVETGLNRNGFAEYDWDEVFARAARLQRDGALRVRGVFSHLSNASDADDARAVQAFERALAAARGAGLEVPLRHLASTAGALRRPDARFDLVRIGIGCYGLSPFGDASGADLGLRPAMTLRSRVALVREVEPGAGVSYDLTWRAEQPTRLVLVPLGYADGIPRAASGRGEVWIGGRRHPVRGRIAMDQFVVDIGDAEVAVGDPVVVFGDPAEGYPSADDWAAWSDSINYEVVTRVGPRVARRS
ncbi:alanine racemase [Herbiconiux sp. L3-i23]|uniref:alanine racemase n=1 Tax=Herbiconiux sp. L3-i23 TaxID=2905871 RepID=UPI00205B296B|nr:alanine racemase [Herbiconiux sp. L3-i23]BDI23836.1 alanine racemase [Herbiconiux sp. L3-i23]